MLAIAPCAKSRLATMSDVFPDWMPAVMPRRSASDATFGVERRLTATPWLNSKIRLRKQRNGGAFRRNRGSRNDRVVAAVGETIEDPVEVVARVARRLQGEAELRTSRPHQFDVETARRPVVDEVEGRIRIGRGDDQRPRSQRQRHELRCGVDGPIPPLRAADADKSGRRARAAAIAGRAGPA